MDWIIPVLIMLVIILIVDVRFCASLEGSKDSCRQLFGLLIALLCGSVVFALVLIEIYAYYLKDFIFLKG